MGHGGAMPLVHRAEISLAELLRGRGRFAESEQLFLARPALRRDTGR
jgi:hypothetical protein